MDIKDESLAFAKKLLLLPDFTMWWPGDMTERVAAMYEESVLANHPELGEHAVAQADGDGWSGMP